ncbi:hypothetical protein HHI36_019787 [Cryptolaemus montrouzieri]|uniref:Luciferin 4-monooxygenase n=1 Tax=Cryptolaemus montrouzieri TaxID=559131 RepID=A0ABD2N9G3_9CUCU
MEMMENSKEDSVKIDDETGEQESYGEFRRKCILVAARLKEKVGKDDIVGLCTSNHKDRSIPYLATLFIGNRVVAFDRQLTTSETSECLKNVTPKIMFVSSNALSHIEESMKAAQVDFEIVVFGDEGTYDSFETYLEEDDSKVENFKPNKAGSFDSTALICFTSGFPDRPKAACLSHYGLLRQSLQLVEFQNILPVILNYCEISQIRTILVLFSSIFAGATRIIVEDFELARLWKLIEKYKIKSIYLNPHQCAEISTLPEPEEDVSSLFCIFTVGERIGKNIVNRLKDTLMGSLICQIYGHTELSGITALYKFKRPEDHVLSHFKPTSCGKPVDGILYKVIDINTGKILNHLATGELYVKSRMVLNGLLVNNKEQPLNKQEWMKTHDLVFYDAYRCFHFTGKINSLIKCNNKVIFPSKLEDILMNHPKVDTAVVLGIPHDGDGEQAIGLVKLNDKKGVSAKDLENLVNSSVSKDEQLKQGIKIIENVPYTSTGKINRAILLDKVLNGKI